MLLDVLANGNPVPKQEDIFENIVFRTPLLDVKHNKKTVYVGELTFCRGVNCGFT